MIPPFFSKKCHSVSVKQFGAKYENTIILEDMTGIFQPMLRCKNPWLAMASRGFCALPRLKTPLVRYFSLITSSYLKAITTLKTIQEQRIPQQFKTLLFLQPREEYLCAFLQESIR